DGWCRETRTAYHFHGCFFHGCPCTGKEMNDVNGKPMARLYAKKPASTTSLRRFVNVVEMWECEWREQRPPRPPEARRRRGELKQSQVLEAMSEATLFSLVECDIIVPDALRSRFAEMLPIFNNTDVTRDDLSPLMLRYAEEHGLLNRPQRTLVGSFYGTKILLVTPSCGGIWSTASSSTAFTRS
ncbi:MAG: hypothetical protein M3H12_01155, partial [Chromatiales bacterium]